MARWELSVKCLEDDTGVDWQKLGLDSPKAGKTVYRKRLVHNMDVEWVGEHSKKESLVKLTFTESPWIILGPYDQLKAELLEADAYDDAPYEDEDPVEENLIL